jgi:hypothetical protein
LRGRIRSLVAGAALKFRIVGIGIFRPVARGFTDPDPRLNALAGFVIVGVGTTEDVDRGLTLPEPRLKAETKTVMGYSQSIAIP